MTSIPQSVLISTTKTVPGYEIIQNKGVVMGITVRSQGMVGDCKAGWQSCAGGEVTAYTELTIDARNQAIQRMIANAIKIGANAVVKIRFDVDEMSPKGNKNQKMANNSIVVYGTAVVIQHT
jgi:uncharacterized protein YbjQ (UPF0145 family)